MSIRSCLNRIMQSENIWIWKGNIFVSLHGNCNSALLIIFGRAYRFQLTRQINQIMFELALGNSLTQCARDPLTSLNVKLHVDVKHMTTVSSCLLKWITLYRCKILISSTYSNRFKFLYTFTGSLCSTFPWKQIENDSNTHIFSMNCRVFFRVWV